jgi:hypothetical protein
MDRPGDALDERGAIGSELARYQDIPLIYTHPRGAPQVHAVLTAFDENLSAPVLWASHRVPLAAEASPLPVLRRGDIGVPILTEELLWMEVRERIARPRLAGVVGRARHVVTLALGVVIPSADRHAPPLFVPETGHHCEATG